MTIEYTDTLATFAHTATVEDAEGLLGWLQTHPEGALDLSACAHLHAANLQLLMNARPMIQAWPADVALRAWLDVATISS
jgi:hypothetical protein